MMDFVIDKELHMFVELVGMFYHYINGLDYISHYEGLIKTQGGLLDNGIRESLKKEFLRLDDICKTLCAGLDVNDPILTFYFKQPEGDNNDTFCLVQQCCEWLNNFDAHSVAEHVEHMKSEWRSYSENGYTFTSTGGEPNIRSAPKSDNPDYLAEQIYVLPYPKGYCMRMFMLYSDFDKRMDTLKEFLERYEAKLKAMLEEDRSVFFDTMDKWSEYFSGSDMVSFFSKAFRMNTEYRPDNCVHIGLMHMQPNRVNFDEDTNLTPSNSYYRLLVGVCTHPNFVFGAFRKDKEKIMELLRLVCDKTKLEIMLRLSVRPYYCLELATEMGMNPGHMSRNLTALYYVGLVTLTKIKGKTFYTVNNERIEQVADSLKELFVHKGDKNGTY